MRSAERDEPGSIRLDAPLVAKQQHLADARWPVEQAASAGKRRAVRDCAALAAPS